MKERYTFNSHVSQYWSKKLLIAAALSAVISGLLPSLMIVVRAEVIDSAAEGYMTGHVAAFFIFLAVFIGLSLSGVVVKALSGYIGDRRNVLSAALLDGKVVGAASHISFSVTQGKGYYELYNRAARASECDGKLFASAVGILGGGVQLISGFITVSILDWRAAIAVIVVLAICTAFNFLISRKTADFWPRYISNMKRADYYSAMLMYADYANERKIFGYSGEIEKRFLSEHKTASLRNASLGRMRFFLEGCLALLTSVCAVILFLILFDSYSAKTLTAGQFTSVFYAAVSLLGVGENVLSSLFDGRQSFSELKGYYDFIALDKADQNQEKVTPGEVNSVEFSHVTFAYPDTDKIILDDISFTFEKGKNYALVGENGCGKSTIVKLILGLCFASSGRVLINGLPAESYSRSELNGLFSSVMQSPCRLPLTIRENVSLYSGSLLPDEGLSIVFDALGLNDAGVGADVPLTAADSSDQGLSGGEWQKLAVARCVLAKSSFVILDEPNSALDPSAEASIYRAYSRIFGQDNTFYLSPTRFGKAGG